MKRLSRQTWDNIQPGFALVILGAVMALDHLLSVVSLAGAAMVGAGIAGVTVAAGVWLGPRDRVPRSTAAFRRAYLPWGAVFIVLGGATKMLGGRFWGWGILAMGVVYLGISAVGFVRRHARTRGTS